MHYYQHHIKDFNSATRHLTRVERALYRDLIELYYDNESAVTGDLVRLERLIIVTSEEDKKALSYILSEFFTLDDGDYYNERCEKEIAKYRDTKTVRARAGKASADVRRKKLNIKEEQKGTPIEHMLNTCSTHVEHKLNTCATNHKPITNNHKPIITPLTPLGGKSTKNETSKTKRFKPPSVEEVAIHCKTRGNSIDAQQFWHHYEANGWMVGRNKMKSWKSALITWEKNSYAANKQDSRNSGQSNHGSITVDHTDTNWGFAD